MSYDIYIGEATPVHDEEDLRAYWKVHGVRHPNAPTFPNDEMTGNGNSRHPAYSGWSRFCEEAGLVPLFFDKYEGLMREHPGCFRLTQGHLDTVRTALDRRREIATLPPGFETMDAQFKPPQTDRYDGVLARLIWLDYWMAWALENCKIPAIYNH